MWFTGPIFYSHPNTAMPPLLVDKSIGKEGTEKGDEFKLAILRIHNPSIQHGGWKIYSNSARLRFCRLWMASEEVVEAVVVDIDADGQYRDDFVNGNCTI